MQSLLRNLDIGAVFHCMSCKKEKDSFIDFHHTRILLLKPRQLVPKPRSKSVTVTGELSVPPGAFRNHSKSRKGYLTL